MNALYDFLTSAFTERIGWVLIHFLWQGVLVGFLYALLRTGLKTSGANRRYAAALCAFAVLALLPVATYTYLAAHAQSVVGPTDVIGAGAEMPVPSLGIRIGQILNLMAPWLVPAWLIGAALLLIKSFAGWLNLRRLVHAPENKTGIDLQVIVDRMALQLGMTRTIRILVTGMVNAPCSLGWFRPLILTPPAAILGLNVAQLEMIIVHELAHIRRHDFLINLLQTFVESILYYHPVVRWISREIRRERECCCDELAVRTCGNPLAYARMLTDLADLNYAQTSMVLGIAGSELALRVDRLIAHPHSEKREHPFWKITFLSAVISAFCLIPSLQPLAHRAVTAKGVSNNALATLSIPLRAHVTAHVSVPALQITNVSVPVRHAKHAAIHEISVPAQSVSADLVALASIAPPAPPQIDTIPTPVPQRIPPPVAVASTGNPPAPVSALSLREQATAPMKIIRMRAESNEEVIGNDSETAGQHHDYCQPLTGSRICR